MPPDAETSRVRLHLDADTSSRSLHKALLERGHDVTRTPCSWMPHEADDESQLLGASAQGRCLFTFNIRDFTLLDRTSPRHHGILCAAQQSWTLPQLVAALHAFLSTTEANEMLGRTAWLNAWRRG